MKRGNLILLIVALLGLAMAVFLLFRAIRFFRFVDEVKKNTPELNYQDTVTNPPALDSLNTLNAGLNQQIAEVLQKNKDTQKEQKLLALYRVMDQFEQAIDTLMLADLNREDRIARVKTIVNKANLEGRNGLFDVRDADKVPSLSTFIMLDDKHLEGTPFECLNDAGNISVCYEKIKQLGLSLKTEILQVNLLHLKTVN